MAIKTVLGKRSVVEAARQRIINAFSNGCKIYLGFSSGKDSICLSHLIYDLALSGQIDAKQLTVFFIDEEAYYNGMYDIAKNWRKRFIALGATFLWYCLPLKQVSAFRSLQNEETFITFEPELEDIWVSTPPPYAITRHPVLKYAGEMNYQTFAEKTTKDGLRLTGIRVSESIMRMKYVSKMDFTSEKMAGNRTIFPIYDWKDSDVWLYIKEHNLEFPTAYMDLYRAGVQKNNLRLSNLFGFDSCNGLRYVSQTDPELWERIERREPNAELVLLYWDSEMFKRSTRKRRELEQDQDKKDYRALLTDMLFKNPERYFTTPHTMEVAMKYRAFYVKSDYMITDKVCKKMYEALQFGDPKQRTLRALYTTAYVDYMKENK